MRRQKIVEYINKIKDNYTEPFKVFIENNDLDYSKQFVSIESKEINGNNYAMDFSGIKLHYANFESKSIKEINFIDTELNYTTFKEATLSRINLTGANLKNVNFEGTRFLKEIDISNVKSLGVRQLENADEISGLIADDNDTKTIIAEATQLQFKELKKINKRLNDELENHRAEKIKLKEIIENQNIIIDKFASLSVQESNQKENIMLATIDHPKLSANTDIQTQSSSKAVEPKINNVHSVGAYLAELEPDWPLEFRELLTKIKQDDTDSLLNHVKSRRHLFGQDVKGFQTEFQYSLLCTAYYGSLAQVNALIRSKQANALAGINGFTVLHIAALKGDLALSQYCDAQNFSFDTPASIGPYHNVLPIHCAIIGGHEDLVKEFIAKQNPSQIGYDYNPTVSESAERDTLELNWLSLAVYAGQDAMVSYLLHEEQCSELITDISAVQGRWGDNILHIAVESFRHKVLAELLSSEYFRSPTLLEDPNTLGLTPFALAAKLGNLAAMRILKDKGAFIDKPVKSGQYQNYRPLQLAEESAEVKAVQLLLSWKVKPHEPCNAALGNTVEELTPSQLAAKRAQEWQQELVLQL